MGNNRSSRGARRWPTFATAVATLGVMLVRATIAADSKPALPAFPGAEGFGAGASGGRGGSVYEVTNLNDDGPGSLREALRKGNRTVVFRTSGTIELKSRLDVQGPNVTIAGQTAPGDGICLRGRELMIVNTDNVIVRFLRLRPGDEQKVEVDALSIRNSGNVIVDHCSMSWSTDSLNDVTHLSGNVTVQWCMLSEPLNQSVHAKGGHGYATGWDGRIRGGGSFHHNLMAHAYSRAPRIGYNKQGRGLIDCRNNVIYNSGAAYGGETDDFNYVANYYKLGPSNLNPAGNIFDVWADDARMYVQGNVVEGKPEVATDNARGVTFKKGSPATGVVRKAFEVAPVTTHAAEQAYRLVVAHAGAVLPRRDAVDRRIVDEVKAGAGRIINSPLEVGGWPELRGSAAPPDADHDGIPDAWELMRGLDPANAADGAKLGPGGYSHLEEYLNELADTANAAPTAADCTSARG